MSRDRARLEAELYRMAIEDGRAALKRMTPRLTDEDADDLVHEFLASRLNHVVEAGNPRGLFIVALCRHAGRSLGKSRRERPDVATTAGRVEGAQPQTPEVATEVRLDGHALLASVSERDQDVLIAVGLGEDREDIAAAHGLGRAAVDQIVSRFRKLARAAEEGDT